MGNGIDDVGVTGPGDDEGRRETIVENPDGVMVVSHSWLEPGEEHADAYVQLWASYDEVLQAQPGFRGRWLVRGQEDRTHMTHLRWWDAVDDYTALTQRDDYADHIGALTEHVDMSRYDDAYPREFADVLIHTSTSGHK